MKYILSVLYIIFTSLGILFMKMGGDSISLTLKQGIQFKIGFITLLGFSSYLVSFILWQKLLTIFDLTYIVPILTGIVQINILLIGIIIFKERLNVYNMLGILFVLLGIVLIGIKKI